MTIHCVNASKWLMRDSWLLCIFLIVTCNTPSKPVDTGEYVERGAISDEQYAQMMKKQHDTEENVTQVNEKIEDVMKLIGGVMGFLGTLLLAAMGFQISTNRYTYNTVKRIEAKISAIEQADDDRKEFCNMLHKRVDEQINEIKTDLKQKK